MDNLEGVCINFTRSREEEGRPLITMAVRIRKNYFGIIGINSVLILLGAGGLIQPTVSAFVHNASTLAISLNSMKNLLD